MNNILEMPRRQDNSLGSDYLRIARSLIQKEKRPMSPSEIVSLARERKLFSDKISGKTPHNTMRARLSVHVREHGTDSIFVRTERGRFHLRELVNADEIYEAEPVNERGESQFLQAAQTLMEQEKRPMSPSEIVSLARERHLLSSKLSGRTPHDTMRARLSVHVRRYGARSTFVRTKRGRFYLRARVDPAEVYDAPPLRAPLPAEKVLIFPSDWLDRHGRFQGIVRTWKRMARQLLKPSVCGYMERLEAEQTDKSKQILSYVMVTKGPRILAFRRGNYSTAADYLRGSLCVGFGGHVSESDSTLFNRDDLGLVDSAVRELNEELWLPERDVARLRSRRGLKIVGLLNDDSSSVGRRHFAFILHYSVSDDPQWNAPKGGEKSVTQLGWLDLKSRDIDLSRFEYWSQLCLRVFFDSLVQAQPSFVVSRAKPLRPPHVLCVAGELGSGKSEATEVLRTEFGYVVVNSGLVLASMMGVPPVPKTDRRTFQRLAWDFISQPGGPKLLASAIWKAVCDSSADRVLVDGIRQRATLSNLRQIASPTKVGLVFIYTPPDVAYRFYSARSRRKLTIHEFLQVRDALVEAEARHLIADADAVVYNWTGRLRYQKAIRALMQRALVH